MAFRSNLFGSITHRGGRDARVPVRRRFAAIVSYADVTAQRSVDYLTITNPFWRSVPTCFVWFYCAQRRASRPPLCIRKPNEFGRNAKTCWRTFANPFWRSVQTCLVLLHIEAGGTPAFQSMPLRGNCRLRRRVMIWNIINTFPALLPPYFLNKTTSVA
ncbi:MAG: hypothetical protein LBQ66_13160 [Planctomycetaceae bacterium]|nr:hypothetical protein [Planctomycetaceae bacterium]